VSTYSHLLVLDESSRATVLDRLHAKLLALPETAAGEFDLPLGHGGDADHPSAVARPR
jgi:hypothetical protein